jgi:hypothetical protein
MVPTKLIILFLPFALIGGWVVFDSSRTILKTERELARLEEVGNAQGASFVRTLQGSHATRQMATYDQRRKLARELANANRNRFFGVLAIILGGLVVLARSLLRRIASEVEEDRRIVGR